MKILLINFHGDHNIGLFGKASDQLCILGKFILEKNRAAIENTLGVKTIKLSIANTDFIGMFCCMNSNGIVIPNIVTQRELEEYKKVKNELGINIEVIKSKFTTLGNMVLCNDNGGIVSKNFSAKEKAKIEDCLGIKIEYSKIAKMAVVGSCGVATNRGCLVHRDADEKEIERIQEALKVKVDIGTANFGSPFVGSCAIANSNGCFLGESTSGPEVQRFYDIFG